MDESRGRSRDGRRDAPAELNAVLHTALQEAMTSLSAVAGTVYLQSHDGESLVVAQVGGRPPEVYVMPERMLPDDPHATARAWRSGEVTVIDEPHASQQAVELGRGLIRVFPASHSIAATPLSDGDHRYGALTLIRAPDLDGLLDETDCARLRHIGDRLARELTQLKAHGRRVLPAARPAVFPLFGSPEPVKNKGTDWGLPGLTGSAPLTQMYQLHKFYQALNRAVTPAEVTKVAEQRFRQPLGADAVILVTAADSRLWVSGHAGTDEAFLGQLHGASATGDSLPAKVLASGEPQYSREPAGGNDHHPVPAPFGDYAAWALLPLHSARQVTGVCCLGWGSPHDFRADEQALMMMMGELLGAAMEKARLGAIEHAIAQSVQTRLLPRRLPDFPELMTTARYLPATAGLDAGMGGDWYDVIPLPDGVAGLVIGDVEGHALEAAGVMGQLRSAIRAYAAEGHPPHAVLTRASEFLAEESELLATCCLVWVDPDAETASVALAGHPAPLIRTPDGSVALLDAPPGVPLGVPGDYQVAEETPISPGCVIALYTDGLVSAGPEDVVSGALRLLELSSRGTENTPDDLADRIVAAVPGPAMRSDDAALLLAEFEAARCTPHHRIAHMAIPQYDMRSVKTARRFVRNTLTTWGFPYDDVELVVSELITNGLIHAGSDVELRVRERPPTGIRLEVRDSDAAPPVPSPISGDEETATAEHGRGLLIVTALADGWGTSPNGRGKTIWAEMSSKAAA